MSFWFSANSSLIRSGLEAWTGVRSGDGGSMSWSSVLTSGSGSDADMAEGRGTQRQPKKLTLWEGMQPEVPAIVKVVWWEREREDM